MHLPKLVYILAVFGATSISASEDFAPFGLAGKNTMTKQTLRMFTDIHLDPVERLAPRASGYPSLQGGHHWRCGPEKLNKICGSDSFAKFQQKHSNMTSSCKSELSEAHTYVCDTWKSGNASQSCAAVKQAWERVKQDHCLPDHGHKRCDKQRLDKICAPEFLPTFEQQANLTASCNSTVTQAWTTICTTWKGANVTASCGAMKQEVKGVMAAGCLTASMMHHESDDDSDGGSPPASSS